MTPDIAKHFQSINTAANQFLDSFGPAFTQTPDGHIETDIAGAASIAGLMLLRATATDLTKHQPGDVIISDVHEAQIEMLDFMMKAAHNLGLEPAMGWDTPIPKEHEPLWSTLQLTRNLERPFLQVCLQAELEKDYYPYVAAYTAIKLVNVGAKRKMFSLNVGKGLSFFYVVSGSKIVPYPLPAT
jgi:hypothetical protein